MAIDTSREAVEQINEELSWDNSFGAIKLINALLAERDAALAEVARLSHAHVAERKLADDLAEAVESAFFAGFSEGQGGTWVEGDPTPAWKKSEAYVVFTRHAARRKE